ncbi:MAG: hypothetical protein ACLU4J_02450 [Butyricimonas paravirosa]
MTNNFSIEWSILDGLRMRAQLGLQKQFTSSDKFLPADHTSFATDKNSENYLTRGSYTYGTVRGEY